MTEPAATTTQVVTETLTASDGTPLGIHRLGSGIPVVMVHGSVSTAESLLPVATHLAHDHSVYVLDRRGRGLSGDNDVYTLSTEAADVTAVVNRAAHDAQSAPVLLGHSYGAICALEAVRLGANISSLVLYEPPLPVSGPVAGEHLAPYAAAIAASDNDAAIRIAMEHFVRMPSTETDAIAATPLWEQFLALAPTWTRELAEIDKSVTILPDYGNLDVRTLLVVGSDSPEHLLNASEYLNSALANAIKYVLQGHSHFANLADPAAVAEAIGNFIAR